MTTDFAQIVKNKTKDELVRIVLNKDEFKNELVEAAIEELKQRDKEIIDSAKVVIDNSKIANPSMQPNETPFGVYLASILFFTTSFIWVYISLSQAGHSTFTDDTSSGLKSIWNIFSSILSIVFGVGILKGKKWGYEWGLGTAILSTLWFGFNYWESKSMLLLFLIIADIVIIASLLLNKDYFIKTVLVPNNLKVKAPIVFTDNNTNTKINDKSYKTFVLKLNGLIIADKKSLIGNSKSKAIRDLIRDLCPDNDASQHLIKVYQEIYSSDLIDELKALSSNYSAIAEYLETFIEHNILTKQYPHDKIN